MKIYAGLSGMVPNIGHFTEGQEVSDEVAAQLEAAGYTVTESQRATPPAPAVTTTEEGVQS